MNALQILVVLCSLGLLPVCPQTIAPESTHRLPTVALLESTPEGTSLDHKELPSFQGAWLAAIKGAQSHIELAHFYASDRGPLGASDPEHPTKLTPVIAALEAAAARGVKIRWLADAAFAQTYPALLDRLDRHANIELRKYWMPELRHPVSTNQAVPTKSAIFARFGPAKSGQERAGVMHAKYMLVDGIQVIFGSANFDWRSLEHIQELGCWITDDTKERQLAGSFLAVFELDWGLAGGKSPAAAGLGQTDLDFRQVAYLPTEPGDSSVQVLPVFSPRGLLPDDTLWDLPKLVSRIDAARSRVFVQVMTYQAAGYRDYFEDLDAALRRAAARGVDVRLIVADWGKRKSITPGLKSLVVMPNIQVRFASIPEASSGHIPFARVVHSKYMLVDNNRAWIGTANWSRSYFESGRNVGLLLDGEPPNKRLAQLFLGLWDSEYALPVDPGKQYKVRDFGEQKQ